TVWRSTAACPEVSSSPAFKGLAAGTLAVAVRTGFRVWAVDLDAVEAASPLGETGRCTASTFLPRRLSPLCRPFQRRTIWAETPKFSATVSTVSPLWTL